MDSVKNFICYTCEGVSKKEIQSPAISSLMGCNGHAESSNVAVLTVRLHSALQASSLGLLCATEEVWVLLQSLEAGLLTLGPEPLLSLCPTAPVSARRDEHFCSPVKRRRTNQAAVYVFFTSEPAQKKVLQRLMWQEEKLMLVLASARGCRHSIVFRLIAS